MGKAAGESPDSAGGGGGSGGEGDGEAPGEEGRRWWRCAVAVLLGAAAVLSALFWLPPFATRQRREAEAARADPWGGDLHTLNNAGNAHTPGPAPQPQSTHQNHNHDHHHHHHHRHINHRHHYHHGRGHQGLQHLTPAHSLHSLTSFVGCGSTCTHKNEHSTAKHRSPPFKGPLPHTLVPAASPNSYKGSYVDPPSFRPRIPPSMRTSRSPNKFSSISPTASI